MLKSTNFVLVCLIVMLVASCRTSPTPRQIGTFDEIKDIQAVSELWVSDPASNLESSEVLIILQGGPREYLYFVKDGRTLARYLPGYKDRHVVYLHQAQTLNPNLFSLGKGFSIERARIEKAATTKILDTAIRYFKDSKKNVTVLGHSYGAFTAIDYLANYESQADKYILTAGRISVPEEMVADNMKGFSSQFKLDGATYIPVTEIDLSDRSPDQQGAYYVRALLKAAYGEPRYTKNLQFQKLSNVVLVTGNSDQQVGVLTLTEATFLQTKGAKVVYVEGGHYDVFKRMIDEVMEGNIDF